MANHDIRYNVAPAQTLKTPSFPKISAMRTALTTFSATAYPPTVLEGMTRNDMISACRVHNLTVVGL